MKYLITFALVLLAAALSVHAHEPAATPTRGSGLKVLVYSHTAYYRHPDIPGINRWLVLPGHGHGIEMDRGTSPDFFNLRSLSPRRLAKLANLSD